MMEENLVVIGWCMGAGDVRFTLLDEQGNILPAEVSRYYRKDLRAVFPEQDAERKPGFQVKADLHDRRDVRKVRLVMEDEDRHRTVCVLKEFRSENKVLKYASKAGNAVRYLERNGKSATIRKVQTKLGKNCYMADSSNYFRMYKFVSNSVSFDTAEDLSLLFEAGKSFGKFQRMLDGFDAGLLHETIVDFHNTPKRIEQLEAAIKKNYENRAERVSAELDAAKKYSKYASLITDAMADGSVPSRVTHNDTKLNNVLFDKDTHKGICVIDLDTVMPGSILYDFGDALRFGASSGAEDETDLSKIYFDLEKYKSFSEGFLGEVGECLTKREIELLPESVIIMTYECGIRFLADYLNGDVYFKIHRENHNLDRARTQLKLVADMETKLDEMHRIAESFIK